ncbi:hypothetical protein SCB17_003074 [Clostridium perfringens]|nr:hypothetical protein [Clostridium perfringens]
MRINVGDKIKLKELIKCSSIRDRDRTCLIASDMYQYFGRTLTVSKIVAYDRVNFEESGTWSFVEDWFEKVIPADKSTKIKLTSKLLGKKIILKDLWECESLNDSLRTVWRMRKFFNGKPVTIKFIDCSDNTFQIEEDEEGYWYAESWIAELCEEEPISKVYTDVEVLNVFQDTISKFLDNTTLSIDKVIVNDRCVIVLGKNEVTGKKIKAVAKCADTDEFDIQKGFEIAITKISIKILQANLEELSK